MAQELDRFDERCSKLKGPWSPKARAVYEEAVRCIRRAEKLTEIRALAALLSGDELAEALAETKRYGKHYEVIIGIGKDHTAHLTLDDEALAELRKMTEEARA